MLYEISNAEDRKKLSSLTNDNYQSIEINALLMGNHPCWIFVDDVNHAKTAVIFSKSMNGFYFVGKENNSHFIKLFPTTLKEIIIPRLKEKGERFFEFSCSNENWISTFPKLFRNQKLNYSTQNVFSFQLKPNNKSNNLPNSTEIFQIDKELFLRKLNNTDFLLSKVNLFWNSIDVFEDKGFGLCLVYLNEIVSLCFSGFVYKNVHCPDVETLSYHQNKGYAGALVERYLQQLCIHNLIPRWECMDENKASNHLAIKQGFHLKEQYKLYHFEL